MFPRAVIRSFRMGIALTALALCSACAQAELYSGWEGSYHPVSTVTQVTTLGPSAGIF